MRVIDDTFEDNSSKRPVKKLYSLVANKFDKFVGTGITSAIVWSIKKSQQIFGN